MSAETEGAADSLTYIMSYNNFHLPSASKIALHLLLYIYLLIYNFLRHFKYLSHINDTTAIFRKFFIF